jgi:hypothetical protein
MRYQAWYFIGFALIAFWLLGNYQNPSLGLVAMSSLEAVGYNIGVLLFPLAGLVFIYQGYKTKKRKDEGQKHV